MVGAILRNVSGEGSHGDRMGAMPTSSSPHAVSAESMGGGEGGEEVRTDQKTEGGENREKKTGNEIQMWRWCRFPLVTHVGFLPVAIETKGGSDMPGDVAVDSVL